MSKTISNFLVGVGLDTKEFDKGSGNVLTAFSLFRSAAGTAGAAIVGAFATASGAAISAGNRIDKLVLSTEKFNTSIRFVYDYGNALRMLGGNADEAAQAINAAESALTQLSLKGNFGPFEDAVFAGVDTSALAQTTTGEEFLRVLSDMMPQLNKDQQRLIQESFGFSDATMRSLREGATYFDAVIARASKLAGGFDEATEAARRYNQEISELGVRIEGLSNTLAEKMLPGFTGIIGSLNDFIDRNQGKIESAMDIAAQNPIATAALTGGGTAALAGAGASAIGLKGLGGGLSRLGTVGLAVGTGAALWDQTPESIEAATGYKPNSYIFEKTPMDAARDVYGYIESKITSSKQEQARMRDAASPGDEDLNLTGSSSGFITTVYSDALTPEAEPQLSPAIASIPARQELAQAKIAAQPPIKNNIELNIELDGRALEKKITNVIETREMSTLDDLQTTTVR